MVRRINNIIRIKNMNITIALFITSIIVSGIAAIMDVEISRMCGSEKKFKNLLAIAYIKWLVITNFIIGAMLLILKLSELI